MIQIYFFYSFISYVTGRFILISACKVFLLICQYYQNNGKHLLIVPSLLAAHASLGYGTVAALCGIGQISVWNVLERCNPSLDALGRSEILKAKDEATIFILHCNGQHRKSILTEARKKGWKDLVVRASLKDKHRAHGIKYLPPTEEALLWKCKTCLPAYVNMAFRMCSPGLHPKIQRAKYVPEHSPFVTGDPTLK